MTPDELQTIGREIYGPAWKAKMASDLGRSRVTVWNWMTRLNPVPDTAARRIRELHDQHTNPRKHP